MTFQPVPDTCVAEIITRTSGTTNWGPAQSNLHFRFSAGYSQADLDNLADAISQWYASEIMTEMSADVQLSEVHVRGLALVLDYESYATISIPTVGSVGGNAAPSNIALCVKLSTGFVGRSARGRVYLGGLAATSINDDDINSTIIANVLAAFNTSLPGYLPTGVDHVIVSRYHNNALRTPTADTLLVTNATISSNQVASQRRRVHR